MKHKVLLLTTIGISMCMICCKKENPGNNTLSGKWQETKLRTYILDSGKIVDDTTYVNVFTKLDYIQFNIGGICEISTFAYYYTPQGVYVNPQSIDTTQYTAIGNGKFTLNTQPKLPNPAGFVVNDTISTVNSNNILLHSVFYNHVPGHLAITDSYYQK